MLDRRWPGIWILGVLCATGGCRTAENDREAAAPLPPHGPREAASIERGAAPPDVEDEPALAEPPPSSGPVEAIRAAIRRGDRDAARALLDATVRGLEAPPPGAEDTHETALMRLDELAEELGDLPSSLELRRALLALRERTLPPDDHRVLAARGNLAVRLKESGDLTGALALEEDVLAARERTRGPEDPDLLTAKMNLGLTKMQLGDVQGAHELLSEVVEIRSRTLAPDDSELLKAKGNLASTLYLMGDIAGARAIFEELLVVWERELPPDDPRLLAVKTNLAGFRSMLGEVREAVELSREVVAAWSAQLAPDHPNLLDAKQNLAASLYRLGELDEARALFEDVLAVRMRTLPPEHPDVLSGLINVAVLRNQLGDLNGAREIEERVLEIRERSLPPDHPDLLGAKLSLANTRKDLGDFVTARVLEEEVLAAIEPTYDADHPLLLEVREALAGSLANLGDLEGALDLGRAVLEARERRLPPDHPDLVAAKINLSITLKDLGDLESALRLSEEAFAATVDRYPPEHPYVLRAKLNLGSVRNATGNLEGARELLEDVLEARVALLPPGHPDRLIARRNAAWIRWKTGDASGCRAELERLLEELVVQAESLHAESPRFAREGARLGLELVGAALFLTESAAEGEGLESELLTAIESLRQASIASSGTSLALAEHPELLELRERVARLREELNDVAARGVADEAAIDDWRAELVRLATERDRAERELRTALAELGLAQRPFDLAALAAWLPADAVAISYSKYPRRIPGVDADAGESFVDELVAFLVRPDGGAERIDLGPARALEEDVMRWRAALGRPVRARGLPAIGEPVVAGDLERLGTVLREHVLDPVLARAPGARVLHVVLDDFLHLVPLDALPLDGAPLGERFEVVDEVSFARALGPRPAPAGEPTLVIAGGLDYDAVPPAPTFAVAAVSPPLAAPERSGTIEARFEYLPGAALEVETVAELHRAAHGVRAQRLVGPAATKAALRERAPGARWLHLATHGWFAPETFSSKLDSLTEEQRSRRLDAEETRVGFAPETLCGLALAGANRGSDELGRVPGILTAEELASLDLGRCELAVLSACETNVGLHRAGQGIQSLQAALHAAGARTAITSLWKVDDAATLELMKRFYTYLWIDGLPKATALWRAKTDLRTAGYAERDWAGWLLSGDPD